MQENFTIDGKTNKHSLLALDHETTILSQTLNEIIALKSY